MERRAHERFSARPYETGNPIYEVHPFRVRDISLGGCALESEVPLRIGPGVQGFRVPLHHRARILVAQVEPIWRGVHADARGRTCHICGLRFQELDDENRRALAAYVDDARTDMALWRVEAAWDRVVKVEQRIGSLVRGEEMDEASRRELDRSVESIRAEMRAADLDGKWRTIRDIRRKIETVIACGERADAIYLN